MPELTESSGWHYIKNVRTARYNQPLQPLLAGFFLGSSSSTLVFVSSIVFLASSTASPTFFASSSPALTALDLAAPQPLAAADLVVSALPALGFAPQPLPVA